MRTRWLVAALGLLVTTPARADTDHEAHHAAGGSAAQPQVIAPGRPPSTADVDAARARAEAARIALARALDQTRAVQDPSASAAALADARAALATLEEALASLAAAEARAPNPTLPLEWFHQRTGVRHATAPSISAVHVVSMAGLVAVVAMLGVGAVRRRRRARALIAEVGSVPTPVETAITAGWSGRLRVAQVFAETPAIKTFRFVAPEGRAIPFSFRAGQYVRVTAEIAGKSVTRAYSISSEPGQRSHIDLTIKREPDGKMSGHFHDRVAVGDVVQIDGPSGQFVFDESRDRLLLIGGGVGMTPLMSVARDLLARGWAGQLFVILSIARPEERLFGAELDLLASRHSNLRFVTVVAPPTDRSTWIDRAFLERTVSEVFRWRVHVCGPGPMMNAMSGFLRELGVPPDQIFTEAFTAVRSAPTETDGAAHQVAFTVSARSLAVRGNATVLDAAELAKVPIDASCRVGICGACKVRLTKGHVTMAVEEALTDIDRANGVVLACQAIPTTDVEVGA